MSYDGVKMNINDGGRIGSGEYSRIIPSNQETLTWPSELLGRWIGPGGNSNADSLNFYNSTGGSGAASFISITGFQTGLELISINGKTMRVLQRNPGNDVEYTLCTNYTISGNILVLTGGDSVFSNIMGKNYTKSN